jgi:hypothetical protein
MAKHIPFVSNQEDLALLADYYSDSDYVRLSLDRVKQLPAASLKGYKTWLDGGFDGFANQRTERSDEWNAFISQFPSSEYFDDPGFVCSPEKDKITAFVDGLLTAVMTHKPTWISVPQLPMKDTSVNKLNRMLVEASERWRMRVNFAGKLILPVIFTHRNQVIRKIERNKRVDHIKKCFQKGTIYGVWAVDSTLSDQLGVQSFEKERFGSLVSLFAEIRTALSAQVQAIAGPYWGMNLVLWARNLADYPAIGLGRAFQYHLPGQKFARKGKARIALAPLRRWTTATPDLRHWLQSVLKKVPMTDPAHRKFKEVYDNFDTLLNEKAGRRQIARFYKTWCDLIASQPESGRALALYQDLSSAYVLGKSLPSLPKSEESARRPERVAQQLMLNCL